MQDTLLIIYLVVSIALVGIILLQQGKGAEMGASFGAGGANTVFGAAGSGNALTKATTILAILFFAIALGIGYYNSDKPVLKDDVLDQEVSKKVETSIESELPTTEAGLESEVAPGLKDAKTQAEDISTELKQKVEEQKENITSEKAALEDKAEKAKEKLENKKEELIKDINKNKPE